MIVQIDEFKRLAVARLKEAIDRINQGEVIGFALAEVSPDGSTANSWCIDGLPVSLIGELHCLMSDIEYYEVDLRKNKETTG